MMNDLEFEIIWYSGNLLYEGPIARPIPTRITTVRKHDLTDAIKAASTLMRKGSGDAKDAHGFYVRRKET